MRFEARVEITHLPGILDPQGANVERALPALGFENVSQVKVGKSIRLVVDSADEASARAELHEMCRRLLANPVIEAYRIELTALDGDGAEPWPEAGRAERSSTVEHGDGAEPWPEAGRAERSSTVEDGAAV
jgi:phosphoribosylformylglycinamidine synthase